MATTDETGPDLTLEPHPPVPPRPVVPRARRAPQKEASPPVYGFVLLLLLVGSAASVLTYTLLPIPGQRSIAGWNYVIAVLFLVAAVACVKLWRPAQFSDDEPEVHPRLH